jgi:hypothetical protein
LPSRDYVAQEDPTSTKLVLSWKDLHFTPDVSYYILCQPIGLSRQIQKLRARISCRFVFFRCCPIHHTTRPNFGPVEHSAPQPTLLMRQRPTPSLSARSALAGQERCISKCLVLLICGRRPQDEYVYSAVVAQLSRDSSNRVPPTTTQPDRQVWLEPQP